MADRYKPKWDWALARQLAEKHGRAPSSIVDCWRSGRPIGGDKCATNKRTEEIDLALVVLVMYADHPMTRVDIADVCGCSPENIRKLENRAMIKLRKKANLITKEWKESA